MITNYYIGSEMDISWLEKTRKAGRPRAIPPKLEPIVIALYRRGYGYRAIAEILRKEYHINPHYSSVRLALKRLNMLHGFH